MERKLLLLLLFVFNVTIAQTPNWTWAKNISVNFSDKVDVLTADNEGNVYLVGEFSLPSTTIGGITFTNTSTSGFSDAYILKFDTSGNLLWHKQLGGTSNESLTSIDSDSDGNIYILGSFGNTITLGGTVLTGEGVAGSQFFAKLNSNGDYLWAKKNSGTNENFKLYDIKADDFGNVFLTGYSKSPTLTFDNVIMSIDSNDSTASSNRVFLTKFDTNGNCLWGKIATLGESGSMGSIPTSVSPDNNGGAAICGYFGVTTLSFDAITLTKTNSFPTYSNMFVVKFDDSGNAIWAHNTGTIYQNNTAANAVEIDSAGNVYVGGFFPNSISFGTTVLLSTLGTQFFLAKFTENGILDWARSSGPSTNVGFSNLNSITTDQQNNVYIAGLTYASTIQFGSSVQLSNWGTAGGLFVTKYSTTGDAIWAKGLGDINQGNNFIDIDCKAENDLYVAGSFNSATATIGTTVLTKSASNSDLFLTRLYAPPLGLDDFETNSISVYPNPVHDVVNFTNLKKNYLYNLYNIVGKSVQQGFFSNEQETLSLTNLEAGLYLMTLTDSDGNTIQKKIVIN